MHTIGIVISWGVVVGSRTTATTIIADYYCGILLEMRKGCSVCGIGQKVGEGKLEQVPKSVLNVVQITSSSARQLA